MINISKPNKIQTIKYVLLFISIFLLTPTLTLNILNEVNNNHPISQKNTVLLYISIYISVFFFISSVIQYLVKKYEKNNRCKLNEKPIIIGNFIISIPITYFVIFIIGVINQHTVNNHVYNSKTENLANISASLQFYTLTKDDTHRIDNSYDIKQDLLNNIVEIKDYDVAEQQKTFEGQTFLNLLGIIMYTNNNLVDSYNIQIKDIIEKKKNMFIRQEYEKYYPKYDKIRKENIRANRNDINTYNNKIKVQDSVQGSIDNDYDYLQSLIRKEWSYHLNYKSQFDIKADAFGRYFVTQQKDKLIKILTKLTDPQKCPSSSACFRNNLQHYLHNYGGLSTNYDDWLTVNKPTTLTYVIGQSAELAFSGGLSLIYQLNPKYHQRQINKTIKHVINDDSFFYQTSRALYTIHMFTANGYPYEYTITYDEFKNTNSAIKNAIQEFNRTKGYSINGSSFNDKSLFNKFAKQYYSNRFKVAQPLDFNQYSKTSKVQQEFKSALGPYYNGNIDLQLTQKDFKTNIIEKNIKTSISNNVSLEQKFVDTLYPYHVLLITVIFALLGFSKLIVSSISFIISPLFKHNKRFKTIIIILLNISVYSIIFMQPISYDLNKSTNLKDMDSISDDINTYSPSINYAVNTIMWTNPKIIRLEQFKKDYYLDWFSDHYPIAQNILKIHAKQI